MALLTSPWEGNKDMAGAIFFVCLLGCKSAIKELIKFAGLFSSRTGTKEPKCDNNHTLSESKSLRASSKNEK